MKNKNHQLIEIHNQKCDKPLIETYIHILTIFGQSREWITFHCDNCHYYNKVYK